VRKLLEQEIVRFYVSWQISASRKRLAWIGLEIGAGEGLERKVASINGRVSVEKVGRKESRKEGTKEGGLCLCELALSVSRPR
jgi:hypothetical protein